MSRSGFLVKVPGKSIFRGAISRSLAMAMFRYHFLHYFYIIVSSAFRGSRAMTLTLETLWRNQRQFQKENLFLEITMFLGQKVDKTGTDSKL